MLIKNAALGAVFVAVSLTLGGGIVSAKDKNTVVTSTSGSASWYGGQFHGRKTANGERFNMNGLTAAHRSLPFGTKVRVTNQKNGKSVVVRINDRGPFHGNRMIDLSRGAASAVDMLGTGVAKVKVDVLS